MSKWFGASGSGAVHALRAVNVDVPAGSFVSILGPSGCGKSTLLRIVAGLLAPSEGEVFVGDAPVRGPNPDVGIVFQNPVLLPWRTALGNIELPVELRKLDRAEHRRLALELIALLGLQGFEHSLPHQLSGGMQQRVSIGRALIHNPSVLLMDEPFGALDAFTREQMNLEVQRIWIETKTTVFFITHSITEALFLSDKVVIMTPRPGHTAAVIPVDVPRPRSFTNLSSPEFRESEQHTRKVIDSLWGEKTTR